MDTRDIQKGMDVFGTDGEKIGTVTAVYNATGSGAPVAGEGTNVMADPVTGDTLMAEARGQRVEASPTAASIATATSGEDYFTVEHGGILHIGAKRLYVPFGAACDVVPGRCVTVSCSKDECLERYATKPDFLPGD